MLIPVWRKNVRPRTIRRVGMTYIIGKVSRTEGRSRPVDVEFIVDSSAVYSLLPEDIWKRLRLEGRRQAHFRLADGTEVTRAVSHCTFEIATVSEVSPVVLGGPSDAPLLGMVTLETLGLMLNPLTRELLPMRLMLASLGSRAA